nr:retrovirus-related Pol polyprotein from transposon TNT 1-94 [Tanacetum cinerariifolium]
MGEDEYFKSEAWVSAYDYVNANGRTMSGCLGDIENFLNNRKLDQVVTIVKSCSLNVICDLTMTMKDLSGLQVTISVVFYEYDHERNLGYKPTTSLALKAIYMLIIIQQCHAPSDAKNLLQSSLDFNKKFYNSLAPNRCSSSIGKTRWVVIVHSGNRKQVNHIIGRLEVIVNGKAAVTEALASGVIPPKTEAQKLARKNELKAKSTLLLAIPDESNKESKKMKKTVLKQQYENFTASRGVGLDNIFDRFQKLIRQLEIHREVISQEDANLKLLRSLPSVWNTYNLIMRNKPKIEIISMDDLYNNLKVYKAEIKGQSSLSSNYQNMAFISLDKPSSTNEAVNIANNVSAASSHDQAPLLTYVKDVMFSFFPNQSNSPQLDNEALEQIDTDDLKEMDLKWQVAMLTKRVKRFIKKARKNLNFNGKETIGFDKTKVKCYNCYKRGHFARKCRAPRNQGSRNRDIVRRTVRNAPIHTSNRTTLIVQDGIGSSSSSSLDTKVHTCSKECLKSYEALQKQYDEQREKLNKANLCILGYQIGLESVEARLAIHQKNEVDYEESIEFLKYDVKVRDVAITQLKDQLEKVLKERDDLKINLKIFKTSSKNLTKPINSQVNANNKTGLGFDSQLSECDSQMSKLFNNEIESHTDESKEESCPVNNRFKTGKGYHVVPPPYTGNYLPPRADLSFDGLDDYVFKTVSNPETKLEAKGIVDSGCSRRMIGNKSYHSDYVKIDRGFVAFGGDPKGGKITGKGKIKTGKLDFEDVYFVEELNFNLFSVSQIYDKKNSVLFTDTECVVLSLDFKLHDENQVLLIIPRNKNMYTIDLKNIVPSGGLTCLFAKASLDESNLWHMRLGHTNFKTLNKLVRGNLFCETQGIKREYSVARTLQQNRVAERKNRTLIEAAKTMLADLKLPTTFWAEVVNTACYVQNKVLVIKPHNKTPYENLLGRAPILSFMRPFGCPVTILNNLDHLGKSDGKSDEVFFVGYYVISKAFRLFDSRTKRVEESLHITFLEHKPNVAGSGPVWLFDIDFLTNSMNYNPVMAENQAKSNADKIPLDDAEKKDVEEEEAFRNDLERMMAQEKAAKDAHDVNSTNSDSTASIPVNPANLSSAQEKIRSAANNSNNTLLNNLTMPPLQDIGIFGSAYDARRKGAEADTNNLEILQVFKLQIVWTLVDLPKGKRPIGTKWVYRNKKDEGGIVVKNKARLVAQGYTQEEGIDYDEPPGFEDLKFPDKVYKVENALYGLDQAPRAWYEALSTYLLDNGFKRGTIDNTLFIKKVKTDILLVQCKKQTLIALSTTEAEYVTAANCYGHTATVKTLDNGEQEINATVDGHVKTVTIASVRKFSN